MLKLIVSPVASAKSRKTLVCQACTVRFRAFQYCALQFRAAGLAMAGAATALLLSTASYAVAPLDDRELDSSFLQNNIPLPQLIFDRMQSADPTLKQPGQQPEGMAQNYRINNGFANLVKSAGTSNIQMALNKKDRELNYSANNSLFGVGILNEMAVKALGSGLSSSRKAGKFSQVIDLSQVNRLQFDQATGSYELNNIQGIVEIEVSISPDNESFRKFRRDYRAFR